MSNEITIGRTVDVRIHGKVHRAQVVGVVTDVKNCVCIKLGKGFIGHLGSFSLANKTKHRYWYVNVSSCQLAF